MAGKKRARDATLARSSMSASPLQGQRLRLLSPKLKRLTRTFIPFDAAVSLRRIEEEEAEVVARKSVLPSNELIGLGSPVLDIVMGFLDDKSLKNCRHVCKSWEEAARRALMKGCGLNVGELLENVRPSERYRVELFTSWILENGNWSNSIRMEDGCWTNLIRKWGNATKSLTLKGLTLDACCRNWIRNLLSSWCPNVEDFSLQFDEEESQIHAQPGELEQFRQYLDNRDAVKFKQIWMAKEDHAFEPYPALPNITSLRVGKKANQTTSYLSINVLLSCQNLKNLFVSEQRTFCGDDGSPILFENQNGGWRMLDFLTKRPDITSKLETFEWQDDDVRSCRSSTPHELVYVRLAQAMTSSRPFLQFGNSLKSLHWNVLHSERDGTLIFPGVLEKVAGSLRDLDLRVLRNDRAVSNQQALPVPQDCFPRVPIFRHRQFPFMPKLSVLKIGVFDCYKMSLNDLVDAAPNLSTLEVSGCQFCHISSMAHFGLEAVDIWKGPLFGVLQEHTQLKSLKTGMSVRNNMMLENLAKKFPNLEELVLDGVYRGEVDLKLGDIFEPLQNLRALKRLKWTNFVRVDIAGILTGFAEAAEKMKSLECCHMRFISPIWELQQAVDHDQFLENQTQLLYRILVTKHSSCRLIVTSNSDVFATEGEIGGRLSLDPAIRSTCKDVLLPYIERHRLPIEFNYSSAEDYGVIFNDEQ
jgi:hypothetical protein